MAVNVDMFNKRMYLFFPALLAVVAARDVEVGDEVTIMCPLGNVEYPVWTGPVTLPSPLTNGDQFVEAGMEWDNNKNLKILSVETKHTGQYKCTSGDSQGFGNPVINVVKYDVTVEFDNVEKESGTDTDVVVAELDTEMTVTCLVKGGNPAPIVMLAFAPGIENPPTLGVTTSNNELTAQNTYTVTAFVKFTATSSVHNNNIVCKATYPGKDPVEKQVPMYLFVPPNLYGNTVNQFPTEELKEMVITCDTTSRPGTSFVWSIDGKDLTSTDLAVEENYQGCTEDSATMLFDCMSNITVSDITKEDNGKVITCDFVYRDETVNTSPDQKISLPFSATTVGITGDVAGVVDDTGSITLTLTCTAGPENPPGTLQWYTGTDKETTLTSTYNTVAVDDEYGGKNVSQQIDVVADRTMDGHMVYCCSREDLCTSVTLDIQYPPQLLAPQLDIYRAYVGDNISIPCIADSSPPAFIAWYRVEGEDKTQISNNTDNPTNVFYLTLINISMTDDAVRYECRAWSQLHDISNAIAKSTQLTVFERPADPTMATTFDAEKYYIEFKTSATAPTIPRRFYIQYRKKGAASWLEVSKGYDDTLPGQNPVTYGYGFTKSEMEPDSEYEIRIKSVDENGLETYSSTERLITDKDLVEVKDDTVSKKRYTNAILISVFATAAFFLIIFLVIACAIKCGKIGAASNKSYVM